MSTSPPISTKKHFEIILEPSFSSQLATISKVVPTRNLQTNIYIDLSLNLINTCLTVYFYTKVFFNQYGSTGLPSGVHPQILG